MKSQLASLDRGTFDPAKAAEIKRYEDAAGKQQAELDRLSQQAQRMGCQGARLLLAVQRTAGAMRPAQQPDSADAREHRPLSPAEIQRLQGNSADREGQRRSILVALGQNDCGPQYRRYANQGPGGFFEQSVRRANSSPERCGRAAVGHLPDAVRAHLRRLLFPDLLFDGAEQVRRRRDGFASGFARQPRRCSTATAIRART